MVNKNLISRVLEVRLTIIKELLDREGMCGKKEASILTAAYFLAEMASSEAKEQAKRVVEKAMRETRTEDFGSIPGPSCYRG